MDQHTYARLRKLFDAMCDLTPLERASRLSAMDIDAELRTELAALFEEDDHPMPVACLYGIYGRQVRKMIVDSFKSQDH